MWRFTKEELKVERSEQVVKANCDHFAKKMVAKHKPVYVNVILGMMKGLNNRTNFHLVQKDV